MADHSVILLAEDREDDIIMIQRAFSLAGIPNPVHVVRDGEQVLAYLKGEGTYANRDEYPLPDLLLLDLQMPRMDGFEVLRWIRDQLHLSTLRIVVLTSSTDMRDINVAYRLGASSFMVKPIDFQDLIHLAKVLTQFWLHLSETPTTFRYPPDRHKKRDPKR
jgi:CheY-like chemotaxis protein